MSEWTHAELMATVLSRLLSDGDVVITGTNSSIPTAAYRLAQRTRAPGIVAISGGLGTVDPTAASVPASSGDPDMLAGRFRIPLPDVVRAEVRGLIDVIFLGALQVDRRGRCNLVVVGDYDAPRLRGPGTLGLSLIATVPRTLVFLTRHDERTLVESVDFVSAEGLRQDGSGIQAVVTPLAVLVPSPERDELRLASVHPGVSLDEVRRRTGFELDGSAVPQTEPPSAQELAALRAVDRAGQLRSAS
jgi:glutaconate CoA-transferase subunit B